ncbi:hypothetical protein EIP91_009379 [Steccherinum ochraceum]|uniref:Uncharacterized protein n=1 Tax=Steccherinum ochraceum TaxID=92696 RepID=A0A4R0R4D6_9APHY|nr:hypothetical protein EIP91_009379 [Steccherinum ochraceum]
MGTICLSLAPILRCQSLNRIQSAVLFIPPALEVVFSLTLIVGKRGNDRKHLFLAAEGLAYAVLSLLDLLAHLVPAVSNNLAAFKGLDITVGSLSFLPLLFFTLFLFFFTTHEIIPTFPQRFQRITTYTLVVFPFFVVLFNQLGSFLTISYRIVLDQNKRPVVAVGYTDDTVRSFMDGLVLALFVLFQALNFSAVFLRLIKAFLNQRQIDSTADGSDNAVHLFRGLGWIAAGIKFGAVEGLIGFASGGFGEALTRRILRFLGRACLIIGVLKGVDTVEDFTIFSFRQDPKRRSALRALISNPRQSTFQQIGGYDYQPGLVIPTLMANAAMIPVASSPMSEKFSPSPSGTIRIALPIRDMMAQPTPNSLSPSRPLVTIRRGLNRAPTLELTRISNIILTSPFRSTFNSNNTSRVTYVAPDNKPRRHSLSSVTSGIGSGTYTYPAIESLAALSPAVASPPPARVSDRRVRHTMAAGMATEYQRHRPRRSSVTLPNPARISTVSATSDSLSVVHNLAVQFPGIPPRITPNTPQSSIDDALKLMEAEEELFPVNGVKRSPSDRSDRRSHEGGSGLVRRSSSVKRKPVPRDTRSDMSSMFTRESGYATQQRPLHLPDGALVSAIPPPVPEVASAATQEFRVQSVPVQIVPRSPIERRYTAPETHVITDFDDNFRTGFKDSEDESSPRTRSKQPRIKSVGSVPRRRTPVPTQTWTRESAVAEWFTVQSASRELARERMIGMGMDSDDGGSETRTIESFVVGEETRLRESARSVLTTSTARPEESFLHYN